MFGKTLCPIYLLLLCSILFLPSLSWAAKGDVILAGKGLGEIKLGMSQTMVAKLLGPATGTYTLSPTVTGAYWVSRHGHTLRLFLERGKIIQISSNSPAFQTPEGLSFQSTLAEIKKRYPTLQKRRYFIPGSGGGIMDYYDALQDGIAFAFSGAESDPTPLRLYAIIVHLPKKPVMPEKDEIPQ